MENNNSCNNIDNSVIFFKIFRNVYIKNKLFHHLNLYQNHYYDRSFQISANELNGNEDNEVKELTEYYYKDYLDKVTLILKKNKIGNIQSFIKLLHKSLPTNVREVNLEYVKILDQHPDIIVNEQIVPNSVETLTLPKNFNFNIGSNTFHSNLKCLRFNPEFNTPIYSISTINYTTTIQSYLPPGLTNLDLGSIFNQFIFPGVLPNTLKTLKLSSDFNKELFVGSLPDSLTYLDMGVLFNIKLKPNVLPKNLKYLFISISYNHYFNSRDILPPNLTTLSFHIFGYYNHPIDESIVPYGVKELDFITVFNHSLANIPHSVKKLSIPTCINIENVKSIPSSVEKLKIEFLNNFLELDGDWYSNIESSLTSLRINYFITLLSIPPNLRKLKGFSYSREPDVYERQVKMLTQHSNLKYLILNCHSQNYLTLNNYNRNIPSQLEFLSILDPPHQLDSNALQHCTQLKTLAIRMKFELLPNTLPNGLITLYIDSTEIEYKFQKDIFPSSLLNLSIKEAGPEFPIHDDQVKSVLKYSNIQTLEFGYSFSHTLTSDNLPSNIQVLIIWGLATNIQLPLPPTLKSIYIYSGNKPILRNIELFNKLSNTCKLIVLDSDGLSTIFKKASLNKI